MSHFSCVVFSKSPQDVDELLAPFNECDETYYEFEPADEAQLRRQFEDYNKRGQEQGYDETTWEDYVTNHEYATFQDGVPGNLGNPNARWDWYEIGGRWSGELPVKPDVPRDEIDDFNQMTAYYVDFTDSNEEAERAAAFWENYVDGKNPDAARSLWNPGYYREQYGTKENYMKAQAEFDCHAFVTPEGEWFEQGRVSWFGLSSATLDSRQAYREALQKMISRAEEENLWVTMVDCHI